MHSRRVPLPDRESGSAGRRYPAARSSSGYCRLSLLAWLAPRMIGPEAARLTQRQPTRWMGGPTPELEPATPASTHDTPWRTAAQGDRSATASAGAGLREG